MIISTLKKTLKILLFISFGFFLTYLVYKDYPLKDFIEKVTKANYFWLFPAFCVGFLSHLFRALRWKMMIESLEYKTTKYNSFCSIIISYFASLAIPRSGEIGRCLYVKKYDQIPITTTFGTVFIERIIDIFITLIMTSVVVLSSYKLFIDFANNRLQMPISFSTLGFVIIAGFFAITMIFVFKKQIKRMKFYSKIEHLIENFKDGLNSFMKVKHKTIFVLYSIGIWVCYFFTTFLCIYCFDFTSNLTVYQVFIMFVFTTYGVMVPTPGGMGAWHFIAIVTLQMFAINKVDAGVFAFVAFTVMNLVVVIFGLISLFLSPIVNKDKIEVK